MTDETKQEATQPDPALTSADPGLTLVPAPATAVAPGADIVGTAQEPVPGEQPGVAAETPVAARTAADPNPEDHQEPLPDKDDVTGTADDPAPELSTDGASKPLPPVQNTVKDPPAFEGETQHDQNSTDTVVEDTNTTGEGEDHPSRTPVASRPTPAGPSSHPHTRSHKYR